MKLTETKIPGLLIIESDTYPDERGEFWEMFQQEKLVSLSFSEAFLPKQINFVKNTKAGVLRGIHAEPWDKYVSVITGNAVGVYLDLREGNTFGHFETIDLKPGISVFIPQGIGNSYQTTLPDTYYVYAVNGHWKKDQKYIGVNPYDPSLNISWPIDKAKVVLSEKDSALPNLNEIEAFK